MEWQSRRHKRFVWEHLVHRDLQGLRNTVEERTSPRTERQPSQAYDPLEGHDVILPQPKELEAPFELGCALRRPAPRRPRFPELRCGTTLSAVASLATPQKPDPPFRSIVVCVG